MTQGPPETGKTFIAAAQAILEAGARSRVAIFAQKHAATREMLVKLGELAETLNLSEEFLNTII